MRRLAVCVALVVAATGWATGGVAAVVVPSAVYDSNLTGPLASPFSAHMNDSDAFGQQFALDAETFGAPVPEASVQAHVTNFSGIESEWYSRVTYYAVIASTGTPPAPVSQVPIHVHIHGQASVSGAPVPALPGSPGVSARASVVAPLTGGLATAASGGQTFDTFDVHTSGFVTPDTVLTFRLEASGAFNLESRPLGSPTQTAEFLALADPQITIDPAFPERDFFRIEFSPNLGVAAVPEGGTGWLLGLAALGAVRRRRPAGG